MMMGWTAVGLLLLVAPTRVGNFLHDNLNGFPEVGLKDWGKKIFLRLVGLGLLAVAARFAQRIAHMMR